MVTIGTNACTARCIGSDAIGHTHQRVSVSPKTFAAIVAHTLEYARKPWWQRCGLRGASGYVCTRVEGHPGPHVASFEPDRFCPNETNDGPEVWE